MLIATINGVKSANIDELFYYYLNRDSIVFNLSTGAERFYFDNHQSARKAADQFFEIYYKQLACIPDNTGRCYLVNVAKVISSSVSGKIIIIDFGLITKSIKSISEMRSEKDNKYLSKIVFSYNFLSNIGDYDVAYVNPSGAEDYTTISDAVEGVDEGAAVIIRAGEYDESISIAKDLVLYFEEGSKVLRAIGGSSTDSTIYILGYGDFENISTSFSVFGNSVSGVDYNSDVYVEFNTIKSGDKGFWGFTGIAKGFKIIPFGPESIMLDSDGTVDFDIDAVSIYTERDNTFIQWSTAPGRCTIRNAFVKCTSTETNINSWDAPRMTAYSFINIRMLNATEAPGCRNFLNSLCEINENVYIYQSMFVAKGDFNFFSDKRLTLFVYGDCYCNKGANNKFLIGNNILHVDSELVVEDVDLDFNSELINTFIMPLTNKPIKSKYTVGDTVYYNNKGAITELTINRVVVEVDNPNNDSEGRQVNQYGFEEINDLVKESRLFTTKNSLLKNLKGNYLNVQQDDIQHRIVINSINSAVSGSTIRDLTGLYLIGFDFTHMDEIDNPDTEFQFDGTVMCDDTSFEDCTLPAAVDTKAEFKALVKSYDKDTTLWTDGEPIGI